MDSNLKPFTFRQLVGSKPVIFQRMLVARKGATGRRESLGLDGGFHVFFFVGFIGFICFIRNICFDMCGLWAVVW